MERGQHQTVDSTERLQQVPGTTSACVVTTIKDPKEQPRPQLEQVAQKNIRATEEAESREANIIPGETSGSETVEEQLVTTSVLRTLGVRDQIGVLVTMARGTVDQTVEGAIGGGPTETAPLE